VEAYLGGREVEAAGLFQRTPSWTRGAVRLLQYANDQVAKGDIGRLPEQFLLAVTSDLVYAFEYLPNDTVEELAVFERGDIRITGADHEIIFLVATQGGRTHDIELDATVLQKSAGAAEVIAALRG
jgi:hypothetical protein